MKKKNLQKIVLQHIKTDDSFTEKGQQRIIDIYLKLNPEQQREVDHIFINLCGYSLNTIINTLKQG